MNELPNAAPPAELFRRRHTAPPRRRPRQTWLLLRALWRAALTVGVPAGLAAWLMTSPRFRLQSVAVDGATRVETAWVAAAVGTLRGRPLLLVSLAEVEQRLARHPWVAGAAIRKDLPSRLVVEISERRPAALAARAGGWTWIDREGRPIAPVAPGEVADRYLRFTGRVERPTWVAAVLGAAERLRQRGPAWARDIQELEVLGPGDFAVRTPALPFRLLFHAARLDEATANLTRHLPEILAHTEGIEAVDLRFARQIVIRWSERSSLPSNRVPEA
jgi:hypothetical protein